MRRLVGGVVVALVALAGCSSADSAPQAADPTSAPSSPTKTLTMLPPSEKPLSGRLTAELQQSSRDVALGRFQVWITNGLAHEIEPLRIVYQDALLSRTRARRPAPPDPVRSVPRLHPGPDRADLRRARAARPRSPSPTTTTPMTFPVDDETGVVERWTHERCDEIAIERVADLEWTPGIRVEGSGSDAVARFQLTATPTGRRGGTMTIDTVGGTPLFTSADGDFWTVGRTCAATDPAVTIELPAQPARCDAHSFGSATGGTTFFVNMTIGAGQSARPAQIRLAMSPEVTAEAFAYAAEACGWEE